MTAREFVFLVGQFPIHVVIFFALLPVFTAIIGLLHGENRGGSSPWKYLYSLIVHLACVFGVLAAVLTGYALFFTRENLLDVNLVVYVVPIVSMTVTLILVSKRVSFDEIPGFDRLSGLMAIIAVTFILILAIRKTRIWLLFGGSIYLLIALVLGLYALLKWGAYMLFRRKDEPRTRPPSLKLP